MESIELRYPAQQSLPGRALVGVVGSGDLEALYEPATDQTLTIRIKTSVDGSRVHWQMLFDRLNTLTTLPSGCLDINDFGATPGVARLRIEQVFEEASHA
ncbi:malonate decarboxylase subunit delta [Pectobacteriaceae bacterium CE90]|nr:malonate decarboxylase subunit delta [Prodigiosinella sp. LS101]WJV51968.1 malonate decarboxylase subunit delta [Prodigiosinella sp. LS101]WJV56324.1 malonate decarboxylase subunit delta [Pectobacteriaceae bacterium C111]WJY16880.1 malonate decarboxylase subunit delta [Pectobacteriaceae bacterium CE90]